MRRSASSTPKGWNVCRSPFSKLFKTPKGWNVCRSPFSQLFKTPKGWNVCSTATRSHAKTPKGWNVCRSPLSQLFKTPKGWNVCRTATRSHSKTPKGWNVLTSNRYPGRQPDAHQQTIRHSVYDDQFACLLHADTGDEPVHSCPPAIDNEIGPALYRQDELDVDL